MDNSFFKIENFSCGYTDFTLKEINLSVQKGSFTGIIGPNGSGKTTLFRGISQSLPTLSGHIYLDENALKQYTHKQRAQKIAIVSQFYDTAEISVEDYVLMGRIPYHHRLQFMESKKDRELARHYMEITDVLDLKEKFMTELSGGEQQRAAIARALCQEPELLLLDEPTAHLDITHQVKILDMLRRLNHELGLSVLMIIHDLNLASEYCEKLILLNKGKVFKHGNPEKVLSYENIEAVYETPVVTQVNPISGKPVVFLISEKILESKKK